MLKQSGLDTFVQSKQLWNVRHVSAIKVHCWEEITTFVRSNHNAESVGDSLVRTVKTQRWNVGDSLVRTVKTQRWKSWRQPCSHSQKATLRSAITAQPGPSYHSQQAMLKSTVPSLWVQSKHKVKTYTQRTSSTVTTQSSGLICNTLRTVKIQH